MKTEKGFTLVELLVVIAIIALLLAVIIPVLGTAREQGRSVVCQTNMKELGLSWLMYAQNNNNNNQLCGAFTYNDNYNKWGHIWDWVWAPWRADYNTAVPINGKCTIAQRKEGIKRGALYKYNFNYDLYRCPTDLTGHLVSYSVPDCLGGMEVEWNGALAKWNVLTKLIQIKEPAKKYVFLEENDTRTYNTDSWEIDLSGVSWKDPIVVWHRGTSNLAFADGHSEKIRWNDETKKWFLQNQGGGLRPLTDGGKKDLKFMVDGWAK